MKKTRKILSVALASVMALSLAACGGSDKGADNKEEAATGEKITLTGMTWGATDNAEKITEELFAANPELAEKYEIEWVIGGANDGEVAEKVRLALSANEPIADFVQLNYTQIPEFAESGVFEDTTAYLDEYKDQLMDGALEVASYQGNNVAFPFELKPRVWFYRQDLFEEAGIDVNDVKTTDDLIAASQKIQEKHPDTYIWNLGQNASPYQFYLALSGNGAKFSDEDGNYCINTDEGTKKVLEDYKKMVDAGVVMDVSDWTPDWENSINDESIISSLSAGWLAQGTFLPTYASNQEGKWAAAAWPEIGGSVGGSDAGGSVFVIPSFSAHPEEAGEFVSALTLSKEGSKAIFDVIAATPINKETLKMDEVKAPNEFFGSSLYDAQVKGLEQLKIFNYSPKADAETTIVMEYFIKAIYGDMSIQDALDAAQNDLETMLGNALE